MKGAPSGSGMVGLCSHPYVKARTDGAAGFGGWVVVGGCFASCGDRGFPPYQKGKVRR